jgi:hypothetical protein
MQETINSRPLSHCGRRSVFGGNNSHANKLQAHPHSRQCIHALFESGGDSRIANRTYMYSRGCIICTLVLSLRYHYGAISIYDDGFEIQTDRASLFATSAWVTRRRCWCIVKCSEKNVDFSRKNRASRAKYTSALFAALSLKRFDSLPYNSQQLQFGYTMFLQRKTRLARTRNIRPRDEFAIVGKAF